MAEVAPVAPPVVSSSIKKITVKPSRLRVKPSHPPTSKMVQAAIFFLKDRQGTSLYAIKKFIMNNYGLSIEKITPLVKRYIRLAVVKGKLIRTRGKGASGSFKLPPTNEEVQSKSSKTSIKEKGLRNNSKINVVKSTKSIIPQKSVISIKKSAPKIPKLKKQVKEVKPEVTEPKIYKKRGRKPKNINKITGTKLKTPKPKKISNPKISPKKK